MQEDKKGWVQCVAYSEVYFEVNHMNLPFFKNQCFCQLDQTVNISRSGILFKRILRVLLKSKGGASFKVKTMVFNEMLKSEILHARVSLSP